MERTYFRKMLIELHKKSGMDQFLDWPFVFDEDENGKILVDDEGQFWFSDERSNWVATHLDLSKVENLRFARCFDEPGIDGDEFDIEDVRESSIYINFVSGDHLWLHNWHETYNVTISPTFVKTDENVGIIDNLLIACKSQFEHITVK